MWTWENRGRIADIERKTRRYPSDLANEERERIAPLMPRPPPRALKPAVDLRQMLNAIRYMARSPGGWRMLPREFGPWQTIYWWFRRFVRRLLFRNIHDVALMLDREQAGREASPSWRLAGQSDRQGAVRREARLRRRQQDRRPQAPCRSTDGRLQMVNLTAADVSDNAGAQPILDSIRKRWPWLRHLFADGAYDRTRQLDKAAFLGFVIEVVRRSDPQSGFTVIPRRWVVKRMFGWMIGWPGLVRDHEKRLDVSEAMIHVAMGSLLRRPGSPIGNSQTDSQKAKSGRLRYGG